MCVVKTKAMMSCAVSAQQICDFVSAYMQKAGFLVTRLNYGVSDLSGKKCSVYF